jgi:hypothetical protein
MLLPGPEKSQSGVRTGIEIPLATKYDPLRNIDGTSRHGYRRQRGQ